MNNIIGKIDQSNIHQDGSAIFFRSGMKIDADGAPTAYHPDDIGLDYLANAGSPGNWYGIATSPSRQPYVQDKTDPAPGYYVSTTALCNPSKLDRDPLKYVNSIEIPYIALPPDKLLGAMRLGDYCMIINLNHGIITAKGAIYADVGEQGKIGEGSISLAHRLGIGSNPRNGGCADKVIYLLFPGSGKGWVSEPETIEVTAQKLFKDWGGIAKVGSFYPDLFDRSDKEFLAKIDTDKTIVMTSELAPTLTMDTQSNLPVIVPRSTANKFVDKCIKTLENYCQPGFKLNLETNVNYFSQRDNYTMSGRTCNSSSCAMLLDWIRRATGRSGMGGDNGYLRKVLSIGDTIYHQVQTAAIKSYGFTTTWMTDDNEDNVIALLDAGIPVVVNILHRTNSDGSVRGGHVIVLIGRRKSEGTLIAHDPYGTLESDYTDPNGAYSLISMKQFDRRWQGGYRVVGAI